MRRRKETISPKIPTHMPLMTMFVTSLEDIYEDESKISQFDII